MAEYDIDWHIDYRVIFACPYGHHTLDSAQRFGNAITDFLDMGHPSVHLIVDDTNVYSAPRNLNKVLRTMSFAWHPSLGWVLMIGTPPLSLRILIDSIARLAPTHYRRFATFPEAMGFLREVDPSIDQEDRV